MLNRLRYFKNYSPRKKKKMKKTNNEKMEMVLNVVLESFDTTPEIVKSKSRVREVADYPRKYFIHICRTCFTGAESIPYAQLGMFLGGRDHATARHAFLEMQNLFEQDFQMKKQAAEMVDKVNKMRQDYDKLVALSAGEYIGHIEQWVEQMDVDYRTLETLIKGDRVMEGWIRAKFLSQLQQFRQNLKQAEQFPDIFNMVKLNLMNEVKNAQGV